MSDSWENVIEIHDDDLCVLKQCCVIHPLWNCERRHGTLGENKCVLIASRQPGTARLSITGLILTACRNPLISNARSSEFLLNLRNSKLTEKRKLLCIFMPFRKHQMTAKCCPFEPTSPIRKHRFARNNGTSTYNFGLLVSWWKCCMLYQWVLHNLHPACDDDTRTCYCIVLYHCTIITM